MNEEFYFQFGEPKRIGFLSTRFAGTDGVTLEAQKWAEILTAMGHSCYWMAGIVEAPEDRKYEVPEAFFRHPEVLELHKKVFGTTRRTREITNKIYELKEYLKDHIYRFLEKFQIEVLIPENVLSIPVHIPLGLAVTEVIAETGIPTIAHHHDFAWERDRFVTNAVNDYLRAAFPGALPKVEHVVINSMAQKELARRCSLGSTIIPNVLNFEQPPPGIDDYNRDFRQRIGLSEDDIMILQPTRVIPRKGIEHAIDLVRQLKDPRAKLVISHPVGDEGDEYWRMLRERIEDAQIDVLYIADKVGRTRYEDKEKGIKIYSFYDVYVHADFVTYPSLYEGFGNAFLEAVYFGKPILVNTYAVYARDIAPLGFKTITMHQFITRDVVRQTREILENKEKQKEWARINYEIALKYFSYKVARRKLSTRLANLFGESF